MLVLGVALLAGFLFIGGGAAIYLSTPPQQTNPLAGLGGSESPGLSLPIFVQETPTAQPTAVPSPTPILFSFVPDSPSPSSLFTPTPSFDIPTPTPTPTQQTGPTPTPTRNPTPTPTNNPTPTPTPSVPSVRTITASQSQTSLKVTFTAKVSGQVSQYQWDFGSGGAGTFTKKPTVSFTYGAPGHYTVTLTVIGPGGTSAPKTKQFDVVAPATPPPPTDTPQPATPSPAALPPS